MTLALILACIISILWSCLFVKLAHESCQDLCQLLSQTTDGVLDMLGKLIAIARSPREKPSQPSVQHLSSKKQLQKMAENHPHNLGFKEESIVVQHAIFALLVDTLNNQIQANYHIVARHGAFFLLVGTMNKQIQVKYQSTPSSPYDTQKMVTSAFLVALFVYATASLAEVTPRVQESEYLRRLVGNTHLFAELPRSKLQRRHLSSKKKLQEMAENHPHNLGFKGESIVAQHAVFALLVDILNNLIQAKYQSMPVSPFETHRRVMSAFFAALFIYATASVAEVILWTQKSVHQRLVGNIRLFASALATTLLLMTLALVLACIISVLWTCLSVKLAYESCQDLCQLLSRAAEKLLEMLKGLIAIARSPREKPVCGNTSSPPEKDHAGEDQENNHAGEHQGDNHAITVNDTTVLIRPPRQLLRGKRKQKKMDANQPNLEEREKLFIVHGVFFLLVGTMNKQIQVKYQSTPSSPYDTQKMVTSAFLVALFVYATASLAEVTPWIQESVYLRRVGNTRLFAGAITAVFLLVLLIPAWGHEYKDRRGKITGKNTLKYDNAGYSTLIATTKTCKDAATKLASQIWADLVFCSCSFSFLSLLS
uniref:PGG domain-containing protein n=1 Tax=Salix viminalis TaxID=40686 RepID=A0A6N2MVJ1_SALVM